jgi:cation/acetate symporter
MFGTAGLPHILMRFFTVPNAKEARKSVFYATGFIGLFFLVTIIIGAAAITSSAPTRPSSKAASRRQADRRRQHAGDAPGQAVGGDVFLGFISAVAFATILAVVCGPDPVRRLGVSHDLYATCHQEGHRDRRAGMVTRIASVGLIAAIVLGIAFKDQNVLFLVALAFGVASSVNFPVLILSMYWKG